MKISTSFLLLLCTLFIATNAIKVQLRESETSYDTFIFEVINNEPEVYSFLVYQTPFEGFFSNMFKVMKGDKEMRYMGPLARRVTPAPPSAHIHVYPETSVAVEVNISKYYEILRSGEYEVIPTIHAFEDVSINSVKLDLHENVGSFFFDNHQNSIFANKYTNCDATQKGQVDSATSTAITQATRAYNCMNAGSCNSLSTTWFGDYSAVNYNYDQTCFQNIKNTLSNNGINAYCDPAGCGSNVYAYVYPNDPQLTVYLCGAFWSQPSERANTVVHEMSHFNVIAGTQDYAYGRTPCKNLANNNPYQASHNADNVCYFSDDA